MKKWLNVYASKPYWCGFWSTKGTVLGPILFLLHINDLPSMVSLKERLFVDDCSILSNKINTIKLSCKYYLNFFETWGITWGMRFTAVKCNIMRVLRTCNLYLFNYSLTGQVGESEAGWSIFTFWPS